ncbi:MAG: beta-ketoacyl-ACP synthase II [Phycisphaerales bacterium JB064]
MPNQATQPRIVITGVGAITPIGLSPEAVWHAMRDGVSGITTLEGEEIAKYEGQWTARVAGQVKGFDAGEHIDPREAKRLDRSAQFGMAAVAQAVKDSGIDFSAMQPERAGVAYGTGVGGISTIEEGHSILLERGPKRLSPLTVPKLMVNATAGNVSISYGLRGPATAMATACASSGNAIGEAVETIRRGRADVMIAGGTEAAITPLCVGAFQAMKALSGNTEPTKASRPFDAGRDGFVLAEGAAAFVLETEAHAKARGATILAELVGWAASADAYHITAPDEAGRGARQAMTWALEDSGLKPSDIGYINAHGTSTPLGDRAEVAAVLDVFGDHARKSAGGTLLMSSTKSVHGHALGASGAVELIGCVNALREGLVPPTINLENPEDGFDIDLVANTARKAPIRYAMNNTFGFGGHNVSLVVGRYDG